MRHLVTLLALTATIALGAVAEAREKRGKQRDVRIERQDARSERRSSTVGPNGTCQRDTGRPSQTLNLNHTCDREEFWARFNDTGDSFR